MKSNSDNRPQVFVDLGNGSWQYNYDIQEVTMKDSDGKTHQGYQYNSAIIWNKPTFDSTVKAVIRGELDETEEFSLINKYNSYMLGIIEDASCETEYKAYLQRVVEIKKQVKDDLDSLGI
jgi:hypothetical protein